MEPETKKDFRSRFKDPEAVDPNKVILNLFSGVRHCKHCDRNVRPIKAISWIAVLVCAALLFFLTIIGVVFSAVYVAYYLFIQRKECPICHGKQFQYDWKSK